MQQMYFCPNCRAPIGYGNRFCGNCGISLKWEILQIPPQSLPLWYDYQHTAEQQACNQQLQHSQPPHNQALVSGNPNRNQQRYVRDKRVATSAGKRLSDGGTITPLGTEISKLLEDFFDKRAKCISKK
jgi:hypothetical protein